jgi:hypothetical protein
MSAADDLEEFYVHTVTATPPGVEGPWGVTPGETSDPLRCFIDDTRRLVRDQQGTETVSSTTLTAPREYFDAFPLGATVHLPHRDAEVIAIADAESGPLDLPDHIEVILT